MGMAIWRSLESRLEDSITVGLHRAALADLLYLEIARSIRFDFACFATTDPVSGVITWASKTRSLGVGDEEFAAAEYGPPDINKFEDIAKRRPPVGALYLDTDGNPEKCRRHREYMQPNFGFSDELRSVFTSRGARWGVLGMYRASGEPPFTSQDVGHMAAICDTVAAAIQRSLFQLPTDIPGGRTEAAPALSVDEDGPAILIIDASQRVSQLTPAARRAIEDLGGWDHGGLPASILAVVANTRRTRDHLTTQVLAGSGQWMSLRAAPLDGGTSANDVAVSIEATSRTTLSHLALAAHDLTAREEEVALLVLQGVSTKSISASLHLSPYTVQDHLKMIFDKMGVRSRRELIAKLVLR